MPPTLSNTRSLLPAHARESADASFPDDVLARAALESTRMAIARWTGGIHLPQMLVPGMTRVSPQARWYARANQDFQSWVAEGGFGQTEGAHCCGPCAAAPFHTTTAQADAGAERDDSTDAWID